MAILLDDFGKLGVSPYWLDCQTAGAAWFTSKDIERACWSGAPLVRNRGSGEKPS